jgi:putative Holliday junction resolvase
MGVINMSALWAGLGRGQRLLGIDPGRKTVGLALSDVERRLASPFGSLRRGRLAAMAAEIRAIAAKENVGGLVVGLPLEMDGNFGPAAQAARDWAGALAAACGLKAAMWDERETTAAVQDFLLGVADMSRARRARVVDRMAAARILQAALDAMRQAPGG